MLLGFPGSRPASKHMQPTQTFNIRIRHAKTYREDPPNFIEETFSINTMLSGCHCPNFVGEIGRGDYILMYETRGGVNQPIQKHILAFKIPECSQCCMLQASGPSKKPENQKIPPACPHALVCDSLRQAFCSKKRRWMPLVPQEIAGARPYRLRLRFSTNN